MDKRIIKTKKALKTSLVELLREKDFDTINTTEICKNAMVSRNTFYNYYSDKYALLQDCFSEYEDIFVQEFDRRQQENNPQHDIRKSFLNQIDTFLDTEKVYKSIQIMSSFDLMSMYYQTIMNILKKYEDKYASFISPEYDMDQLNSFLALGFWGFIHADYKMDREKIRQKTHKLILDLLESPIFRV